ncbi:MAG TPA: hypothetical protein VLL48_11085, partial [Longimicrobiales bacterium]|nr:hypothetical protein [Longimicrobiales bacterium]
ASGVPGAAVESLVPVPATYEQTASVPLDIQSAGSRYVATLARFSGEAARLSVEERRMAREVALAALYGAAVELLREAGDDETLEAVAEMVARRRGDSGQLNDGARSF